MPVQGINNQLLELLLTPDKKIQNFIKTLKPGDILNGKIIDLFQNENKAIINFRGYNVISQLPQNINIQKGDKINVIVYNINDKIYMRLNNILSSENLQSPLFNNSTITTDIINTLNSLKIPINEHNLFIAQNLIKYQLSVNKENIDDINNSLINYLQNKGIDYKIFNLQNTTIAKEIFFTNILKLNNDIVGFHNNIINQDQLINTSDLLKFTERIKNFINISSELNNWIPDQKIIISKGDLIINYNKNFIENLISLFEKNGFTIDKNQLLSLKSEINISLNNNIDLIFNNDSIIVKFKNLISNFNDIIQYLNKNTHNQISSILNDIILSLTDSDIKNQNLNNLKPELYNLKNIFDEISKNVFQPNNIKYNDNIKQIYILLNSFKNELENIKNIFNRNDLNKTFDLLNKTIDLITKINSENIIKPHDFIIIQNTLKQFIADLNNIFNFKNLNENKINIPINQILNTDLESIIESLVFLKARNININNNLFIDIMAKYFSNNMKLSDNIEKLNHTIQDFFKILQLQVSKTDFNNLNKITDILNIIKNTINEISLKLDNNNLKPEIILEQIKNFINKSGLNIENNIKNLFIENNNLLKFNSESISGFTFHNNLKSLLIKLSDELNSINYNNIHNDLKKYINEFKDISKDILNN
ncbi:MAG: hypothetical protein N3E50_01330, partial [Candidatus Goldbacteria bacterium]|nr:hypothetical protein [Candidatus Goldiibacteriota bacterium]